MPYELLIALRYLTARRKQAFISVISSISTLGVIVGVMALIIALGLMTGLQQEIRNKILGSSAHVSVFKTGPDGMTDYRREVAALGAQPHVRGAAPAVYGKALLSSSHQQSAVVTIKGIDPALERTVTDLGRNVVEGKLADLGPSSGPGGSSGDRGASSAGEAPRRPDGILLGQDVAKSLGVFVGDSVTLTSPEGTLSPFGRMPRVHVFRVVGISYSGLYEFDSAWGYIALPVAQRIFDKGSAVDLIELRVDDIYRAPAIAADLTARLGPAYVTQDWAEMNRSLFSALWLEKMAISITIGLIVLVAALNIIATLILLVMEKNKDIAILKTMGATARSITAIFMLQGVIIGTIGTFVGATAGYTVARILDRYRLIHIPVDVYQISYVPFRVQHLDLMVVIVAAVLICFLATIYPSRQAARLDPAEALRYE